jgi:pantetheine-phosphate adenylyltransferase
MCKVAICPGSFDPITIGHINIIERGLRIFDKLIIAIAINTMKTPIFSAEERLFQVKEIFKDYKNVEVDSFGGLLVEYAKKRGVKAILRGIRNMSDYEYESQMVLANKTLDPHLEFVYMMTEGKYAHLSSSIIKEVITFGGSGHGMIHPIVEKMLKEKLKGEKPA